MNERFDGPRVCRGSATGDLMVWLVGAGTLVGLVVVLAGGPATESSGTQE